VLGLPDTIRACLFDLDGVLTPTEKIHAKAWKQMFDDYLKGRDEEQAPFDLHADYDEYVDGRPRYEGVQAFLASRGIELPRGTPEDPPDAETIDGLGNRKNELVQRLIEEEGVEPYPGSMRFVRAAREAGLRCAVVSSSANAKAVLHSAGYDGCFDAVIDATVADRDGLKGKPEPDTFLAGARALDVDPAGAAVFEDALAGVQAGRAGSFGCVVGVNRADQAQELRAHGADFVVDDLAELLGRS
jgi:beta-phosphoglucomutase family hydrolase